MLECKVLCASHLTSPQRYFFLLSTIDQILNQNQPVDFYISIYTDSPRRLKFPEDPHLHLYYQQKPLSQFEHFYFLASLLEDPEHTFCIFCDDDDFSCSNRISIYSNTEDIGQQAMLVHKGLLLMHDEKDTIHTFEKCQKMLLENKAEIVPDAREYFMYCVRASQLLLFCQIMRRFGYLHLNVCDILFGSILFFTESKKLSIEMKNNKWIYAYSSRPKNREIEYQTYHNLIKDQILLHTLRQSFHLPDTWKGKTFIYGEYDTCEIKKIKKYDMYEYGTCEIKRNIKK